MLIPNVYQKLIPESAQPIDEPFGLNAEFAKDTDPSKVNLGLGVYRTDEGLPWPFPTVEKTEKLLQSQGIVSRHEYLTIQGDVQFLDLARDLAFDFTIGSAAEDASRQRIVSVQTVSGTGANHVGAKYLSFIAKPARVWLPDPTWGNHFTLWELVGIEVRTYPYYDGGLNFDGMVSTLKNEAQPGDVVLLHACAHNPTGSDPSKEQWKVLAELCKKRGLIPFFDLAYQGFASGDLSEDAWAIKHFFSDPSMGFLVAQSFSKNFGLYGQRAGALHVVTGADQVQHREAVLSNMCHIVRGDYSMAPRFGSDIVRTALADETLRNEWKADLQCVSGRIKAMRKALYDELVRLGTPGTWNHLVDQIGMFSYTGLTVPQVMEIRKKHHVYMLRSGRVSMSGVTTKNVAHIAQAMDDVVRTIPKK